MPIQNKPTGLDDLIESLTIFKKYDTGTDWPTTCEHDVMWMCACDTEPGDMDAVDAQRLADLGWDYFGDEGWQSFRYGSA